jgi:hypothetical protein
MSIPKLSNWRVEKDAKLPGLNVLEGVDPRILNGWHVYPRQQDYNPELD